MGPEDATPANYRALAESGGIPNVFAETCARVVDVEAKSAPARCGEFYTPEGEDSGVSEISPRDVADASSEVPTDIAWLAPVSDQVRNPHFQADPPTELTHRDAGDTSGHTENTGGCQKIDIFEDLLQEPSLLCDGGRDRAVQTGTYGRESIRDEVHGVCIEATAEFPDACIELRPCLYIIKYMVQNAKNISLGSMHISNFLRIIWLIHKEDYRCRVGNFYKYHRGAWVLHGEKKIRHVPFRRNYASARGPSSRYRAGRWSTTGSQSLIIFEVWICDAFPRGRALPLYQRVTARLSQVGRSTRRTGALNSPTKYAKPNISSMGHIENAEDVSL